MRFEDLGLVNTFACLHHQEPVWLLPVVLQVVCFLLPDTHQTWSSTGKLLNAGTMMTS